MKKIMLFSCLFCGLMLPTKISAQVSDTTLNIRKNFEFSFSIAGIPEGPLVDVDKAFRSAGLSNTYKDPKGWGDQVLSYPTTNIDTEIQFQFNIGYRIHKNIWIHLITAQNKGGTTEGYKKPGTWFALNYSVLTIATALYYKYGIIKVGLGPALYFTESKFKETYSSRDIVYWFLQSTTKENSSFKVGLLLDASLQYPENSLFFVQINYQYRLMTSVQLGPYNTVLNGNLTVPQFDAQYSHSFLGFGLGVRL